jgi:hypothetical protein
LAEHCTDCGLTSTITAMCICTYLFQFLYPFSIFHRCVSCSSMNSSMFLLSRAVYYPCFLQSLPHRTNYLHSACIYSLHYQSAYFIPSGPGSSVGIANGYGLDGTGIEFRWGEIFRNSPDRHWGPPSLPYNGYRVFPLG